jgi:hypothetical protein
MENFRNSIWEISNFSFAIEDETFPCFLQDGFDYVLVYIDDPQTFLPKMAVQYAAKSSLPDFMAKLHDAAKVMLKKLGRPPPSSTSPSVLQEKENIVPKSVSGGDVFGRSAAPMPAL